MGEVARQRRDGEGLFDVLQCYTVRLFSALSVTFGDSSPGGRAIAGSSLHCLRQRLGIGAPNAAANGMSDYIAGEELQLFQCADQSKNPQ